MLPKNAEIDAALAEYQRLFVADEHADTLAAQRSAALEAMEQLQEFRPRLVGPVLTGTATPHQEVQLHLFADTPEAVYWHLMEEGVPYRVGEQRVRMNAERVLLLPTVEFTVSGLPVEAAIFASEGIRQSPLSPTDGRPMRRAAAAEVRTLLESGR